VPVQETCKIVTAKNASMDVAFFTKSEDVLASTAAGNAFGWNAWKDLFVGSAFTD
jgi:hypothetical protein